MNRVSAKIAQKIRVLLQHDHVNAGPRQQKPRNHPRSPPPATQQRVETFSIKLLCLPVERRAPRPSTVNWIFETD
jgi:hypothetical protein